MARSTTGGRAGSHTWNRLLSCSRPRREPRRRSSPCTRRFANSGRVSRMCLHPALARSPGASPASSSQRRRPATSTSGAYATSSCNSRCRAQRRSSRRRARVHTRPSSTNTLPAKDASNPTTLQVFPRGGVSSRAQPHEGGAGEPIVAQPAGPDGDRPWLAGGKRNEVFMATDPVEDVLSHAVFQSTDGGNTCSATEIPDNGTSAGHGFYGGDRQALLRLDEEPRLVEPVIFGDGLGDGTWNRGDAAFTPHFAVKTSLFAHWPSIALDSANPIYLAWDTNQ